MLAVLPTLMGSGKCALHLHSILLQRGCISAVLGCLAFCKKKKKRTRYKKLWYVCIQTHFPAIKCQILDNSELLKTKELV